MSPPTKIKSGAFGGTIESGGSAYVTVSMVSGRKYILEDIYVDDSKDVSTWVFVNTSDGKREKLTKNIPLEEGISTVTADEYVGNPEGSSATPSDPGQNFDLMITAEDHHESLEIRVKNVSSGQRRIDGTIKEVFP